MYQEPEVPYYVKSNVYPMHEMTLGETKIYFKRNSIGFGSSQHSVFIFRKDVRIGSIMYISHALQQYRAVYGGLGSHNTRDCWNWLEAKKFALTGK
jgi:hypothetical protein